MTHTEIFATYWNWLMSIFKTPWPLTANISLFFYLSYLCNSYNSYICNYLIMRYILWKCSVKIFTFFLDTVNYLLGIMSHSLIFCILHIIYYKCYTNTWHNIPIFKSIYCNLLVFRAKATIIFYAKIMQMLTYNFFN